MAIDEEGRFNISKDENCWSRNRYNIECEFICRSLVFRVEKKTAQAHQDHDEKVDLCPEHENSALSANRFSITLARTDADHRV